MTMEATQKRSASSAGAGVITGARKARKSSITKPYPSVDGPIHIGQECDGNGRQAGGPPTGRYQLTGSNQYIYNSKCARAHAHP